MKNDILTLAQLLKGYKKNISGKIQIWWCGFIVADCRINELFPYFKLANVESFDVIDGVLIVAVSCCDSVTILGKNTELGNCINGKGII